MTNINSQLIDEIKEASCGLLWMSKKDYPFEVFVWEEEYILSSNQLLQLTGHPPETRVEVIGIDQFFGPAICEQEWYNEEDQEMVMKYRNLVELLKYNLENIRVYFIGEKIIDVYLVGSTRWENLAGLSTRFVEI